MKYGVTLLAVTAIVVGASTPGRAADKSEMADAAMKGDKAALRRLLQQHADVNAPQIDGATALHWAVYRDDLEAAGLLIAAGAKVDAANREAFTPLAMASLYGNVAMIERLLEAGADAKQRLANGETMLMLAARNGNPRAIRMLVAAGADVNAKETWGGTTALMWAASERHPGAVKVLTGSTNFSVTGLYVNSNHVLVFNDPKVATKYAEVFAEAWNDGASKAKFAASQLSGQQFAFSTKLTPKTEISFAPHTEDFAAATSDCRVAT